MNLDTFKSSYRLLREHLKLTPLRRVSYEGHDVYLKLENQQITGSFKARGALSKLGSLSEGDRSKGIVTASTGNHGMGVANACDVLDVSGTVYLPEIVVKSKRAKLDALGIDTALLGKSSLETEIAAKAIAQESLKAWISPYNDVDVIIGQGTIAIEFLEQYPEVKRVFVTVGGGGLVSGIGSVLNLVNPDIEIVGCQPLNSPEMFASIRAGEIVSIQDSKPTLSDGSAGGVEDGSITFEICKRVVDRWELISEDEIRSAIRIAYNTFGEQIEGAAGVALAAWMRDSAKTDGDVVVICGGNIDPDILQRILSEET